MAYTLIMSIRRIKRGGLSAFLLFFLSHEVFEETVVFGEFRLREDVFLIESLVNEGFLRVKRVMLNERATTMLKHVKGLVPPLSRN